MWYHWNDSFYCANLIHAYTYLILSRTMETLPKSTPTFISFHDIILFDQHSVPSVSCWVRKGWEQRELWGPCLPLPFWGVICSILGWPPQGACTMSKKGYDRVAWSLVFPRNPLPSFCIWSKSVSSRGRGLLGLSALGLLGPRCNLLTLHSLWILPNVHAW